MAEVTKRYLTPVSADELAAVTAARQRAIVVGPPEYEEGALLLLTTHPSGENVYVRVTHVRAISGFGGWHLVSFELDDDRYPAVS